MIFCCRDVKLQEIKNIHKQGNLILISFMPVFCLGSSGQINAVNTELWQQDPEHRQWIQIDVRSYKAGWLVVHLVYINQAIFNHFFNLSTVGSRNIDQIFYICEITLWIGRGLRSVLFSE